MYIIATHFDLHGRQVDIVRRPIEPRELDQAFEPDLVAELRRGSDIVTIGARGERIGWHLDQRAQ